MGFIGFRNMLLRVFLPFGTEDTAMTRPSSNCALKGNPVTSTYLSTEGILILSLVSLSIAEM
ncbi:MAG: hypothetical protein RSB48_08890, partial [Akkermansia sp.]